MEKAGFTSMSLLLNRFIEYSNMYSPVKFSPFGAVLACVLLTYGTRITSFIVAKLMGHSLSNVNPRENPPPKGTWLGRAYSAHLNGFETLIVFSAAVGFCVLADVPKRRLEELCTVFVILRMKFTFFYIFLNVNEALSFVRTSIFVGSMLILYEMMLLATEKKYGYVFKLN